MPSQPEARIHWKDDAHVAACEGAGCGARFSLFRRRHHCRRCGGIYCASCSRYRLATEGGASPVRACKACHAAEADRSSDEGTPGPYVIAAHQSAASRQAPPGPHAQDAARGSSPTENPSVLPFSADRLADLLPTQPNAPLRIPTGSADAVGGSPGSGSAFRSLSSSFEALQLLRESSTKYRRQQPHPPPAAPHDPLHLPSKRSSVDAPVTMIASSQGQRHKLLTHRKDVTVCA
ncbi:Protein FREE1 [Diplonema papillatum]|nr:Protein FREE1 [Diplonema papillatum]